MTEHLTQFAPWRKRWYRLLFRLGFAVPANSIFTDIGEGCMTQFAEDWIGPDDRELRLADQFARDMHSRTSGDWGAAGWVTKQAFRSAAISAVRELNKAGFDLLDVLPKGAQGRV